MKSDVAIAKLPIVATKSWAAVLKDTPLNPDAKAFKPIGLQGSQIYKVTQHQSNLSPKLESPPGLESPSNQEVDHLSADSGVPTWMQYLNKKFESHGVVESLQAGPPGLPAPPGLESTSWVTPGLAPGVKLNRDHIGAVKHLMKETQNHVVAKSATEEPPGLPEPPGCESLVLQSPYLETEGKLSKSIPAVFPGLLPQLGQESPVLESPGLELQNELANSTAAGPPGLHAPPGLEPPESSHLSPQGELNRHHISAVKDVSESTPHPQDQVVTNSPTAGPPGLHGPPEFDQTVSESPVPEMQGKPISDRISEVKQIFECMQYQDFQHQVAAKSGSVGPSGLHTLNWNLYGGQDLIWNPYNVQDLWNPFGCINQPLAYGLRSNHAGIDNGFVSTEDYLKMVTEAKQKSSRSRAKSKGRSGKDKLGGAMGYISQPLALGLQINHAAVDTSLVKEGKRKRSKSRGTNKGNSGKDKLGGAVKSQRKPCEADPTGPGPTPDVPMRPTTASGQGKKKAGAVKADAAVEHVPEDVPCLTTQDDIGIEKQLLDQDLADPAYWSETECVSCRGPSAHLFGRRPRTKSTIRSYVMQDLSFDLDHAVAMLLLRLQRLIDHQKAFKQDMPRRFLMGLNVVARRAKKDKMDCLIVAPDVEEYARIDGLGDRMQELLAIARERNIPVIFALSRTRLGHALGKSLFISVLGVLDSTGARDLMALCLRLADASRQAWCSRAHVENANIPAQDTAESLHQS